MCMGRDINGLSHERKKLDVQVACTIHHLCGDIAFTGHPSVLRVDQKFLCRRHDRHHRSRTGREAYTEPRPRRRHPARHHDTVCPHHHRIRHSHRIDAALHFRSPMATVRQDTGSDRALQTGKRDVPCPAEKQRKRIQQAQQDLGKADDSQYPQLPVAKGIHRKRLA